MSPVLSIISIVIISKFVKSKANISIVVVSDQLRFSLRIKFLKQFIFDLTNPK
jgi:hypothetical protein